MSLTLSMAAATSLMRRTTPRAYLPFRKYLTIPMDVSCKRQFFEKQNNWDIDEEVEHLEDSYMPQEMKWFKKIMD